MSLTYSRHFDFSGAAISALVAGVQLFIMRNAVVRERRLSIFCQVKAEPTLIERAWYLSRCAASHALSLAQAMVALAAEGTKTAALVTGATLRNHQEASRGAEKITGSIALVRIRAVIARELVHQTLSSGQKASAFMPNIKAA